MVPGLGSFPGQAERGWVVSELRNSRGPHSWLFIDRVFFGRDYHRIAIDVFTKMVWLVENDPDVIALVERQIGILRALIEGGVVEGGMKLRVSLGQRLQVSAAQSGLMGGLGGLDIVLDTDRTSWLESMADGIAKAMARLVEAGVRARGRFLPYTSTVSTVTGYTPSFLDEVSSNSETYREYSDRARAKMIQRYARGVLDAPDKNVKVGDLVRKRERGGTWSPDLYVVLKVSRTGSQQQFLLRKLSNSSLPVSARPDLLRDVYTVIGSDNIKLESYNAMVRRFPDDVGGDDNSDGDESGPEAPEPEPEPVPVPEPEPVPVPVSEPEKTPQVPIMVDVLGHTVMVLPPLPPKQATPTPSPNATPVKEPSKKDLAKIAEMIRTPSPVEASNVGQPISDDAEVIFAGLPEIPPSAPILLEPTPYFTAELSDKG